MSVQSMNQAYGEGSYETVENHLRNKRKSSKPSWKKGGDAQSNERAPPIDSGSVSLSNNGVPMPKIKRDLNTGGPGMVSNVPQSVPISPTCNS